MYSDLYFLISFIPHNSWVWKGCLEICGSCTLYILEQCFKNLRETESGPHTPCFPDWRWNHFCLSSFWLYCWSPNSSTLVSISSRVIISQLPLHNCHVFVLHPWLSFWAVSIWWRWWRWWKCNHSEKKAAKDVCTKWFMLGIQLHRWSNEILSGGHSFWEWLDRALQVFILYYEEWSCWSKFQASKK